MGREFYIIAILSLLLCSCKSIQYVPVETIKTVYQNHTDTIKQTDSIVTERNTIIREADSTLVAELGLKLKDNERAVLILKRELERQVQNKYEAKTDTIIKTDSIPVPYPVEKQLSRWDSMCLKAGHISIGLCVIIVLILLIGLVVKKKFKK